MAPRRTPRKERSDLNLANVGVVGRRTGTTLKDTGVRDENGIEPIPTFSSPAKSLFQPNGTAHDGTNSAEDSMDIDQSTIPEPPDLMRSAAHRKYSLPPRATSPIKTHLNSSPRRGSAARSVGPISSPSRNLNSGTPTRATTHPPGSKPVNRTLDFSPERLRDSVEYSPQKVSLSNSKKQRPGRGGGKGKKVFDLTADYDDSEAEAEAVGGAGMTNGVPEDEPVMLDNDDQLMMDSTMEQGAPLGGDAEDPPEMPETEENGIIAPATSSIAKGNGKKGGNAKAASVADHNESLISLPGKKRPGRPPKKPPVFKDPVEAFAPPSSPVRGRTKAAPSERDPNVPRKIAKNNKGKPPSRSLSRASTTRYIQRSATPANDSGALITRFGRQSIKPLATWRGEKAVMGDRTMDSLPGIKEVVRVDEVVEQRPRPRRQASRTRRNRAKSRLADVEEEEEEEEKAAWEVDPGIMMAQVMDWDPNANRYDEESTREEDIAYAFEAIEMRDINNADFKFAKTLTLDFFGSGMVHLPPGGAKRIKNSRKMQMVFFVFYGRVTVNIGTPPTKFSIGKGGQWQVPRGNFYSITNESETNDARIFFAQGCEVEAGIVDESTMA